MLDSIVRTNRLDKSFVRILTVLEDGGVDGIRRCGCGCGSVII